MKKEFILRVRHFAQNLPANLVEEFFEILIEQTKEATEDLRTLITNRLNEKKEQNP